MLLVDPPQVKLSLGSTLKADDIKEGDDVYFECQIQSNPKEHRIGWSHDVSKVSKNIKEIILKIPTRCRFEISVVFRLRVEVLIMIFFEDFLFIISKLFFEMNIKIH